MFTILQLLKKGLIADLKMVEMSQVLKDNNFKDCWNIRLYAYSALPFDKCYPCWYWTNIQILDDLSENISLKSDLQLFLFGLGFVKKIMSRGISNWYQPKMSKWSKDGFRTFVFIKTCFTFQKMLIVEQTRGIKREILCFKSGEERIIENGPGVFDFKGRKIAQNARTFIFTADKNPFNQSSQSIKSCDIRWEKDETLICKSKPQF